MSGGKDWGMMLYSNDNCLDFRSRSMLAAHIRNTCVLMTINVAEGPGPRWRESQRASAHCYKIGLLRCVKALKNDGLDHHTYLE